MRKRKILALVLLGFFVICIAVAVATFFLFNVHKEEVAKLAVTEYFADPLSQFRMDIGRYPRTDEGLRALLMAPDGLEPLWQGPYLVGVRSVPLDPWGREYQYHFPAELGDQDYDLYSKGKDGTALIGNWMSANQ